MFGRNIAIFCAAAVYGLAGCASHQIDTPRPEPRPLWNEVETYQAPSDPPDPQEPAAAEVHEPAGELRFQDALALALLHSPKLADVAWNIRISEARALQAGLRPNPEIGVEVEEFGGEGPRRNFDAAESTVRLSQRIELGGKRSARRGVRDVETQLAWYDYETERLAVLTDATLNFIDVLTAQKQLDLAEDLHRLSEETFEAVAERVRAGKVSPLEETKASIELANSTIELATADNDLKIARRQLAANWGSTAPRFVKATGTLDLVEEIPSLESLESLVRENPAVARWAEEMNHRFAELALERAQRVVDLTLSAGATWFSASDDYAFVAGMSVPIPLFDRNQGGIRKAKFRAAQTEQQARFARVRVTAALSESYQSLASARTEALALESQVVPAAGRAFEAARSGYRQGKFGYLEVLDAQRTYAEANARLIDALARCHRAVALVEGLVGARLELLLEDSPSKLEEQP